MKPKIVVDDLDRVYINGKRARLISNGGGERGRLSYSDGNIIVKLNDLIAKQSQREIKLYKEIERKDKKYFGKVISYDDTKVGWIAVVKEKFKRGRINNKNREIILKIATKYNIKDIYDDCPINWGVRENGIPFIFDWGC